MTTTPPKRSRIPLEKCNLAKAVEQIGDRWSLLILRSAFYGLRRFGDFQSELEIPRTVLSGRLKRFVENGLMETRPYREAGQRPRPEYFLTQKGADLAIAMIALNQWGDKWLGEDRPAPLVFEHKESNAPLIAALTDDPACRIPMSQAKRKISL
ncbi:helix-turn-helix domain-containing protein [Parvularcula sp. IMCC14364]|uniref:winged helix-turn-helix transcriptional regulator n=1 Tax=Parvularcula sp. IMCC14364 TaxID=3067902 RepID=UPI0027426E1A|nr:helix-turn-helix domain-containing protein [Parvularcula sp. IMCC14364]